MADKERPLLVTLIGVIFLLLGLFGIANGIITVLAGVAVEPDAEAFAELAGGTVIVIGVIYLIVALGFFRGWSLWWYLGVLFTIIGIIVGILSIPVGLIVTVVCIIILWYLFRDKVKRFFLG